MKRLLALFALCLPFSAHAITLVSVVMTVSPSTFQVGSTATVSCLNTFSDSSQTTTCTSLNSIGVNASPTASIVSGATPVLTGVSPGPTTVVGCFNSCTQNPTGGTFTVTPPNTEYLGAISAAQVSTGLGWNLGNTNLEYQVAKAGGATYGRIQCSWVSQEIQNAPPADTSGGFSLETNCGNDLGYMSANGISPTIVAAYGAPYHRILLVTVPAGASAGATTLGITFASGVGGSTISSMRSVYNTIEYASGGNHLSPKHDYGGSFITNVNVTTGTTATITLASALSNSLPADGTQYQINEYLYPPSSTASYTDTQVGNYASYAQFLAQQINSHSLSGQVEIWNEPPWPDSCWDNYGDCFDTYANSGATIGFNTANRGFAAALQNMTVPANTSYIWAGTNKSGDETILGGLLLSNSGLALAQPSTAISSESLHPYGGQPEAATYSWPCLVAAAAAGVSNQNMEYQCNLFGVLGGNGARGAAYDAVAKMSNANNGLNTSITETGVQNTQIPNHTIAARFLLRQFIANQAAHITPVEFYRLYAADDVFSWGVISGGVWTPYQQYTSMAAFMADINTIKSAPITALSSTNLIASYSGLSYPLTSVQIVGAARATDPVNSTMVVLWQRTYGDAQTTTPASWAAIASPTGGSAVINIPTGTAPAQVVDTVTRSAVSYTVASNQVTVPVADNPVEILFEPASSLILHNLGTFNGTFN